MRRAFLSSNLGHTLRRSPALLPERDMKGVCDVVPCWCYPLNTQLLYRNSELDVSCRLARC